MSYKSAKLKGWKGEINQNHVGKVYHTEPMNIKKLKILKKFKKIIFIYGKVKFLALRQIQNYIYLYIVFYIVVIFLIVYTI